MVVLKVIAITLFVLTALYVIGGLVLKHKLYIRRPVIICLIISIAGFLVISHFDKSPGGITATAKIQNYQKKAPNENYVIQTSSRIYYAVSVKKINGYDTALQYYTWDGKKWVFRDNTPLVLNKAIYGDYKIYKLK